MKSIKYCALSVSEAKRVVKTTSKANMNDIRRLGHVPRWDSEKRKIAENGSPRECQRKGAWCISVNSTTDFGYGAGTKRYKLQTATWR